MTLDALRASTKTADARHARCRRRTQPARAWPSSAAERPRRAGRASRRGSCFGTCDASTGEYRWLRRTIRGARRPGRPRAARRLRIPGVRRPLRGCVPRRDARPCGSAVRSRPASTVRCRRRGSAPTTGEPSFGPRSLRGSTASAGPLRGAFRALLSARRVRYTGGSDPLTRSREAGKESMLSTAMSVP